MGSRPSVPRGERPKQKEEDEAEEEDTDNNGSSPDESSDSDDDGATGLTDLLIMLRGALGDLAKEAVPSNKKLYGGLGIPPEFCAKVLHQEVLGFLSRHSTSTLSTIHFVLNPADQTVIQAFRTEHQRLVSGTNATPRTTSAAIEQPMQEATVAPASWTKTAQTSLMPRLVVMKPSDDSLVAIRNGLTGSGIKNTINSIIRIENMALYQEYDARKTRVQMDCPGVTVERILFHGTKADAVQDISINGFNRSYHGSANAALYGNGVYFAVNPAYSAQQQYSPPDGNKIKYIYQCRVLTGVFCKGTSGLRAPPQIPSLPDGVRYDSVTDDEDNPTIFVILRDSQVYPEYLIKLLDTDSGSTPDSNVVP